MTSDVRKVTSQVLQSSEVTLHDIFDLAIHVVMNLIVSQ